MLVRLLAGATLLAAICLPSAASAQYGPYGRYGGPPPGYPDGRYGGPPPGSPDGRYGGPPPGYPDGRYGGPPPGYPDGRYGGPPPFSRFFGGAGGSSSIGRTMVMYPNNHKPGTIVISTRERRLYLVLGNGQALSYGIGVGRVGFTWSGVTKISAKREWPSWTPPAEMRQRRPDLPRHMAGGIDNPLGARAMYLGSSLYRIHGSNEPETIGQAVSSGCFRLTNEDVIDLYNRVPVGATVIVQQ